MSDPAIVKSLCVIGVGLIGGSIAQAARQAGACEEIIGCDRDAESLQKAVELGVIDRYELDPGAAVAQADLVMLAVPMGAMGGVFEAIKGRLPKNTVLTDAGSAKASVVADIRRVFGQVPANYVPGHPIAGTEKSGVEASFANLYRHRRIILTPTETTSPIALSLVRALWESFGSEVSEMSVAHHDEVLAATSHLPHMLAYTLVDTLARMDESEEIFRYAAGGFRDFTRIASSDPTMWRDICFANREALLAMIGRFHQDLNDLAGIIENGNGEEIFELFSRAKAARDRFAQREQHVLARKDHY